MQFDDGADANMVTNPHPSRSFTLSNLEYLTLSYLIFAHRKKEEGDKKKKKEKWN